MNEWKFFPKQTPTAVYGLHLLKFLFDSEFTKTKDDQDPHLNLLFMRKVKTCMQKRISYIELKICKGRIWENQATFHATYDLVINNAFKTVGNERIHKGLVIKSSTLTISASPKRPGFCQCFLILFLSFNLYHYQPDFPIFIVFQNNIYIYIYILIYIICNII